MPNVGAWIQGLSNAATASAFPTHIAPFFPAQRLAPAQLPRSASLCRTPLAPARGPWGATSKHPLHSPKPLQHLSSFSRDSSNSPPHFRSEQTAQLGSLQDNPPATYRTQVHGPHLPSSSSRATAFGQYLNTSPSSPRQLQQQARLSPRQQATSTTRQASIQPIPPGTKVPAHPASGSKQEGVTASRAATSPTTRSRTASSTHRPPHEAQQPRQAAVKRGPVTMPPGSKLRSSTPPIPPPGSQQQLDEQDDTKYHPPAAPWHRWLLSLRTTASNIPTGYLYLLLSAVLWGTSPPCTRFLYLQAEPPSPAFIAAAQNTVSATLLSAIVVWQASRSAHQQPPAKAPHRHPQHATQTTGDAATAETTHAPYTSRDSSTARSHGLGLPGGAVVTATTSTAAWQPAALVQRLQQALTFQHTRLWAAGLELGLWGFLANAVTVLGFQHTNAAQGAFLLRLASVFTPLIAAAAGESVPLAAWAACGLACAGGCLMVSGELGGGLLAGLLHMGGGAGAGLMLVAASLWAMQTFRISRQAQAFQPLQLAAWQMGTMAGCSCLWVLWEAVSTTGLNHAATASAAAAAAGASSAAAAGVSSTAAASAPTAAAAVVHSMPWGSMLGPGASWVPWAVLLFPAVFAWMGGVLLQLRGQSSVPAPQAMVIFATDPLWATLFAGLLSAQEQQLGLAGAFGASLIVSAGVLVIVKAGGRVAAH